MKSTLRQSTGLLLMSLLCLPIGMTYGQEATTEVPVEQVQMRDRHTKHFKMPDGSFKAKIYAGSQHYMDAQGNWQDIQKDLVATSGNFAFENTTNTVQSFFPSSLGGNNAVEVGDGAANIRMASHAFTAFVSEGFTMTDFNAFVANGAGQVNQNTMVYPGAGLVDHEFAVEWDMVKHNVLLNQLPANLPQSGYMAFGDAIELPAGWSLEANGKAVDGATVAKGGLFMRNAEDEGALSIPIPDVYERNDPSQTIHPDGAWPISYYVLPQSNNTYWVMTMVPVEWLADAGRQFPVVVDPTVNVVGAWGGWQGDANNFVEGNPTIFAFVGDLGGDHRGWIKFDVTTVPDNSLVTLVEANLDMNNTGTGGPVGVDINDVTGTYGEYGQYLMSAYTDFGNGTYNTVTCSTAAVYGGIDLGITAVGHMQAQLPVDEFQISMDSGQDPDWKRFTSNLSSLDVTYVFCTPPSFSVDTKNNVSCFGFDDGMVTTTASGGSPPYSYAWTSGDTTSSADSLAPGQYVVTLTDTTGCFDTLQITILEPDTMMISFAVNGVDCNGDATGDATATVAGGVTPYSYSWSSGGSAAIEQGLNSSIHTLSVTDANGCVYTDDAFVPEPAALVISIDSVKDVTCEGDEDGMIISVVSGGVIPYVVAWDDPGNQLSQTAVNLPEGLWTIEATDGNGCISNETQNVGHVFDAPDVNLGPDVAANAPFYDLTAPAGFAAYEWSGSGATSPTTRVFAAGTYTVSVTDDNGCVGTDEIVISAVWASGVEDLIANADVQLFPNPTEGVSTLVINGLNSQQVTLEVTNIQGQIIDTKTMISSGSMLRQEIDLSDQSSGVYFLRLTADDQVGVLRLTVK